MNKKQSNVTHLRQNYQIKVVLEHIRPPVWRRLQLDSRITLDRVHEVIQASFGWFDSHMHQFTDRAQLIYREPDEDAFLMDLGGVAVIDEKAVLLSEVLKQEKDWIKYEYDFGDGWSHKIILEKITPFIKNQIPVVCMKGKRACPPEDCGGPWGYQNMLEQMASADEGESGELEEWLGGDFDPEYFNLKETNILLRELFQDVTFNGRPGLENELKSIEIMQPDFAMEDFSLNNDEWLNDPAAPPEIKELLKGMQETIQIFGAMDELLDQAIEGFESIIKISKDRKVTAIAKKMLKILDEE